MNTRRVKAGEPAPEPDWKWLEPKPEPKNDMEKIQNRILGTIFLSACMFVLVVLWVLFA